MRKFAFLQNFPKSSAMKIESLQSAIISARLFSAVIFSWMHYIVVSLFLENNLKSTEK